MNASGPALAAAPAGSAVVVEGLTKRFGDRTAVSDVSFTVESISGEPESPA